MGKVEVHAFNPYEAVYPGRKTISRPALDLVKKLRSQGHEVLVRPDDERNLEYIARKGFIEDVLSDPLFLKVAGFSAGVVTGLISNWLYDKFGNQQSNADRGEETKVVIEVEEEGNRLRYSETGEPISDEKFDSLLHFMEKRKNAYFEARKQSPPNEDLRIPIFLEHSFEVVGWTRIRRTNKGLLADPAHISNDETLERIERGELNGFSVGGIVRESECTICGSNYVECNHIGGESYDGQECVVKVSSIELCDVSIVKEPVNPDTRIELKDV